MKITIIFFYEMGGENSHLLPFFSESAPKHLSLSIFQLLGASHVEHIPEVFDIKYVYEIVYKGNVGMFNLKIIYLLQKYEKWPEKLRRYAPTKGKKEKEEIEEIEDI